MSVILNLGADAQPPAAGDRRWLLFVAMAWTAVVALVPTIFGVVMLRGWSAVAQAGLSAGDVFRAMAYRNFAFSAVLAAALVAHATRGRFAPAVAFLLAARGLTELADGLSGVFAAGPAPYLGALGDLAFAAYFLRRARRA